MSTRTSATSPASCRAASPTTGSPACTSWAYWRAWKTPTWRFAAPGTTCSGGHEAPSPAPAEEGALSLADRLLQRLERRRERLLNLQRDERVLVQLRDQRVAAQEAFVAADDLLRLADQLLMLPRVAVLADLVQLAGQALVERRQD